KGVLEEFSKFKDVVAVAPKEKKQIKCGRWAGSLGKLLLKYHIRSYEEATKTVLMPLLELTENEYAQLLIDFAEELDQSNTSLGCYRIVVNKRVDVK
ncbi:8497_t:CDS:2, partial [Paraglomus brasilianum]